MNNNLEKEKKYNLKNKKWIIVIGIILIIIYLIIVIPIFVKPLFSSKHKQVYKTIDENIEHNCNNYTSYIRYNTKYTTAIWKQTYDIGECDGIFVKNTLEERIEHTKEEMDNYAFYQKELEINNIAEINSLFDEVLYYTPDIFNSTLRVIVQGESIQDLDKYSEPLIRVIKIYNKIIKEKTGNENHLGAMMYVCFTPDNNFSTNNYYKAFLVNDMSNIAHSSRQADGSRTMEFEYNIDKINISECTNLIGKNDLETPEEFEIIKQEPIIVKAKKNE